MLRLPIRTVFYRGPTAMKKKPREPCEKSALYVSIRAKLLSKEMAEMYPGFAEGETSRSVAVTVERSEKGALKLMIYCPMSRRRAEKPDPATMLPFAST